MNIHERIYKKAKALGLLDARWKQLSREGYLPLNVERVERARVSVSHTYVQEGDIMRDPEIVIEFNDGTGMAEAISFQNDGLGIYQEVYVCDGDGKKTSVYARRKRELNEFLHQWLTNLKDQGFDVAAAPERKT